MQTQPSDIDLKSVAIAQANTWLKDAGLPTLDALIDQLRLGAVYMEDAADALDKTAAATENGMLIRHSAMASLEASRCRALVAAFENADTTHESPLSALAKHAVPGMKWIMRNSTRGRGLRLHQDPDGLYATPTQAIQAYLAALPAGEGKA